jgi:uncharacterized protein (TIGR00255 family)
MAVYSMTGYASAASEPGATGPAVLVEARSVNSRFLDLALKLPEELRGLEPALRERLSAGGGGGKIELRMVTSREAEAAWPAPSTEQLNRLAHLESSVQAWLPKARPLTVNEVMHWCRAGGASERLDEPAMAAAAMCIEGLRDARAREGARLVAVLLERVARLRELVAAALPLVPAVVQRQQAKFLERWQEALAAAQAGASIPAEALRERALGEAATFALRIDVAEELARLGSHLSEIQRLLEAGGEVGKRLDFLIQELLREANTLGSKSAALELTSIAVEMKVAIEQMREQVQNLE